MEEIKIEEEVVKDNDEDIIACYSCGFVGEVVDELVFEDNYYCKGCYDSTFTKCHNCDETTEVDEVYSYDGEHYCEDCYHEVFTTCSQCGEIFFEGDLIGSEDGEHYCEDCYRKKYTHCYACSCELDKDDMFSDDRCRDYCSDCYWDIYTTCSGCGEDVEREDSIYNDDDGETYCRHCYDDIEANMNSNGKLFDYNYKPIPIFYGDKNGIHLGIELEVEGSYDGICDSLDQKLLYHKRDGSLDDGFEIVSHPMTYEYIKESRVFEEALSVCRGGGYKSHDTSTCGMHIHVSKKLFSSLHLFKVLKLVYENEEVFLTLAQRDKEAADRWANFHKLNLTDMQSCSKTKSRFDRYEAVNLSPRETVEFRFMKGNLLIGRFNKNIEIILSIINFTKRTIIKRINKDDYFSYVFKNEKSYSNLVGFCREKDLYTEYDLIKKETEACV